MTIPANPAVPNIPLSPELFDRVFMDKYSNVLRLYFNQLNTTNASLLTQVSANQTLIWLGI